MLKNIFTKEMGVNALVTLGVVMVALAVHDKFVSPRLKGSTDTAPSQVPVVENGDED